MFSLRSNESNADGKLLIFPERRRSLNLIVEYDHPSKLTVAPYPQDQQQFASMKTTKVPDVAKEANDNLPAKLLPRLPNELITHIIYYALEDAYPDYLRIPPPPRPASRFEPSELERRGLTLEEYREDYISSARYMRHFDEEEPRCVRPGDRSYWRKGEGPQYEDGAFELTSAVKSLALVSTDWLQLTHMVYSRKLSDIKVTERAFFEKETNFQDARDYGIVQSAFWAEWNVLNACGYGLANAEQKVRQRHEQERTDEQGAAFKAAQSLEIENARLKAENDILRAALGVRQK